MPPPTPDPTDLLVLAPMSEALRALARRGELRRWRRGVQLITEGEHGDTLYIILDGRLRAYTSASDGRELTYGTYGAGEYVGEMGLDGGPRSANVEVAEAATCSVVVRPVLRAFLEQHPPFAFELLAKVIWRARHATLSLKQIALNDVYGRLRPLLEAMAARRDDRPAPTHREMAQQLGCSREMVSRVLKDLEKGGYLAVGRRRVALLKPLPAKW
jgi:CRP/FNR family cyclic AMP-dependent transcriptional regulator